MQFQMSGMGRDRTLRSSSQAICDVQSLIALATNDGSPQTHLAELWRLRDGLICLHGRIFMLCYPESIHIPDEDLARVVSELPF